MATSRVNDNEDISKMIKIIGFGGWGGSIEKTCGEEAEPHRKLV